jgi:hypothetical protein
MRFFMTYSPHAPEGNFPPSRAKLDEMSQFVEEAMRTGELLFTEGLLPSSKGARVRCAGGQMTVVDGPFTEAKELVGGIAIVQANSKADAIEMAKRFLQVAGDGETEVRQIAEISDFG